MAQLVTTAEPRGAGGGTVEHSIYSILVSVDRVPRLRDKFAGTSTGAQKACSTLGRFQHCCSSIAAACSRLRAGGAPPPALGRIAAARSQPHRHRPLSAALPPPALSHIAAARSQQHRSRPLAAASPPPNLSRITAASLTLSAESRRPSVATARSQPHCRRPLAVARSSIAAARLQPHHRRPISAASPPPARSSITAARSQ